MFGRALVSDVIGHSYDSERYTSLVFEALFLYCIASAINFNKAVIYRGNALSSIFYLFFAYSNVDICSSNLQSSRHIVSSGGWNREHQLP